MHPHYRRYPARVQFVCLECSRPFSVVPSKAKTGEVKYCCKACAAKGWRNRALPFTPERFWSHVDKSGDCWVWQGRPGKEGYGTLSVNGHPRLVHRLSWEMHYGPIPEGLLVCHKCDVNYPPDDISYRLCVRPDHLFIGTNADNIRDMWQKGRSYPQQPYATYTYGSKNHWAKLTDEQVIAIRNAYALETVTYAALAAEYGVTLDCIARIATGNNWPHLPQPPGDYVSLPGQQRAADHRSHMNDAKRAQILAEYAEGGVTCAELAKRYGVRAGAVGNLARAAGFVRGKPPA